MLNDERVQAITAWLSMPDAIKKGDDTFPQDLPTLAKRLGVGVREIERWKKDPRVYKMVAQNLKLAALYLLPNALYAQGELALEKKDTKALRAIAQIAGVLADGGVQVYNTQVQNSSMDVTVMPDKELFGRAASIWAKAKDAELVVEEP